MAHECHVIHLFREHEGPLHVNIIPQKIHIDDDGQGPDLVNFEGYVEDEAACGR